MSIYGTSLIKMESMTQEDINDFLVECVIDSDSFSCYYDEQALLEGANSDITAAIKKIKKEIKQENKAMRKAKKNLDLSALKKHNSNIDKLLKDTKSEIKSIDSNVGEAILGYIIGSVAGFLELIAVSVLTLPISFITVPAKNIKNLILEVKNMVETIKEKGCTPAAFNHYRSLMLGYLDEAIKLNECYLKSATKYIDKKKSDK